MAAQDAWASHPGLDHACCAAAAGLAGAATRLAPDKGTAASSAGTTIPLLVGTASSAGLALVAAVYLVALTVARGLRAVHWLSYTSQARQASEALKRLQGAPAGEARIVTPNDDDWRSAPGVGGPRRS